MLVDLLFEVVSSILGDVLIDGIFRDPRSARRSPQVLDDEWNASLGTLAAFLSSLAAIAATLASAALLTGTTDTVVWLALGGAMLLALCSGVLAARALAATGRPRAMTRPALWLSRATILAGLLVAALSLAGVGVA